ncbi:MAG: DUF4124 domain-containing protein [Betaproteobacteria bacterium]|nr:MAG: DUF4124 domain-containing protein [Betaproteobacteria bacterium]
MTTIKGIVALAFALAPVLAVADTVYKYQRPDGKVVYSDVPLRGAKLIGRFELVPLPPRGGARGDAAPGSADISRRTERRISALDAADADIKAAEQALKDAEERQQAGVEPLPGDRLGTVGGRSRLTPDYFERQRALAAEVDAARARLDEAYRQRNQLRE